MTRTPKILLALSITTFSLSHLPFFADIGWGILNPIGAAAFILFFITHVLAKEMALFDQEHQPATGTLPAKAQPPAKPAQALPGKWSAKRASV